LRAFAAPGQRARLGRLTFDVIRKGKDIGDYSRDLSRQGRRSDVDLRTDVKVKVPVIGVSAYTLPAAKHRDMARRQAGGAEFKPMTTARRTASRSAPRR
jgi:hypothetical protein